MIAQTSDSLVGTWKLVSASATRANGGARNDTPYGANLAGVLIYTREGRMAAMVSHSGRAALSVADRGAAPAEQRAEAFATFFAYSGRYTLKGGTVVHHVEVASIQNWVDTDQVRLVKYHDDRITLVTPPRSLNGSVETFELVWERVK